MSMTVRIDTIGDWSNSDHIDGKGKHQQTPPLLLSLCFRFLQKGKREELLKLTVVHFLPSGVHSKFIWGGTEKAVEVKIGDESKSGASCSKIEKGNQKSHKSAIFLWFAKSQNLDRERKEVWLRTGHRPTILVIIIKTKYLAFPSTHPPIQNHRKYIRKG